MIKFSINISKNELRPRTRYAYAQQLAGELTLLEESPEMLLWSVQRNAGRVLSSSPILLSFCALIITRQVELFCWMVLCFYGVWGNEVFTGAGKATWTKPYRQSLGILSAMHINTVHITHSYIYRCSYDIHPLQHTSTC